MINMSCIAQTSGGSCSVCLTVLLGDTKVLDYHLFPNRLPFSLKPSHKLKENTALVLFDFIFLLHLTTNKPSHFIPTSTEPSSKSGGMLMSDFSPWFNTLSQFPILKKQGYLLYLLLHPLSHNNTHHPRDYAKQLDLKLKGLNPIFWFPATTWHHLLESSYRCWPLRLFGFLWTLFQTGKDFLPIIWALYKLVMRTAAAVGMDISVQLALGLLYESCLITELGLQGVKMSSVVH